MSYPPSTPSGWQDPAAGSPQPAPQQPMYIDPISGQPATVANPAAYPTPEQTYGASYGQPEYGQTAYSQPGYAGYGGYPGYPTYPGYPGPPGYPAPVVTVAQRTNGLSIASLVLSLCGVVFLFCYGGGALLGLLGAILGHVSRGQLRQRGEGGGGLALAGIIVGWTALALGAIIVGVVVWAVARFSHSPPTY